MSTQSTLTIDTNRNFVCFINFFFTSLLTTSLILPMGT